MVACWGQERDLIQEPGHGHVSRNRAPGLVSSCCRAGDDIRNIMFGLWRKTSILLPQTAWPDTAWGSVWCCCNSLSCRFSEPGCSEELFRDTNKEITLILTILGTLLGCCFVCLYVVVVCMYVYSVFICVLLPWLVVKNTTASHTFGNLTENNTETTSSFGFSLI